jgi:benzylsuccinate synthase
MNSEQKLQRQGSTKSTQTNENPNIKEVTPMTTCKECKSFFPLENDQAKGDCVQRVKDPRQAYYQSRPAKADDDAGACGSFQKKQKT